MNTNFVQLDDQDKLFFKKILSKASNAGFIRKKYRYDMGEMEGFSCCVLTTSCCAPRGKKGFCIVAVIALALSFFVGLFFTISSSVAAASAKKDLRKVDIRIGQLNNNHYIENNQPTYLQPNENESLYDQKPVYYDDEDHYPSAPPLNEPYNPEYLNNNVQLMNEKVLVLYRAAEDLLEDYHTERSIAAFSQALMTAGCAALITALVIHCLLYGQDMLCIGLGVGGGVAIVAGLFIWLKKSALDFDNAKLSARALKGAIDKGVKLNI